MAWVRCPFWADQQLGEYLPELGSISFWVWSWQMRAHYDLLIRGGCWTKSPRRQTALLSWCLQMLWRCPDRGFAGTRSHRACSASCFSQTHWHFFLLRGHPSCLLPVREVGEAGHAQCQETGQRYPTQTSQESRGQKEEGLEYMFSFQILCFISCF